MNSFVPVVCRVTDLACLKATNVFPFFFSPNVSTAARCDFSDDEYRRIGPIV